MVGIELVSLSIVELNFRSSRWARRCRISLFVVDGTIRHSPSSRHEKDVAALATEAALADEKGPSRAKHGQPDLRDLREAFTEDADDFGGGGHGFG